MNRCFGSGADGLVNGMHAVRLETVHNNAAANPDHGRSAGRAEKCEETGHTENKGTERRLLQIWAVRRHIEFDAGRAAA